MASAGGQRGGCRNVAAVEADEAIPATVRLKRRIGYARAAGSPQHLNPRPCSLLIQPSQTLPPANRARCNTAGPLLAHAPPRTSPKRAPPIMYMSGPWPR